MLGHVYLLLCTVSDVHDATSFIEPELFCDSSLFMLPLLGNSAGSCSGIGMTFTVKAPLVRSHCFTFPVILPGGNSVFKRAAAEVRAEGKTVLGIGK